MKEFLFVGGPQDGRVQVLSQKDLESRLYTFGAFLPHVQERVEVHYELIPREGLALCTLDRWGNQYRWDRVEHRSVIPEGQEVEGSLERTIEGSKERVLETGADPQTLILKTEELDKVGKTVIVQGYAKVEL